LVRKNGGMAKRDFAQLIVRDISLESHQDDELEGIEPDQRQRICRIPVDAAVILNADIAGVQATACDVSRTGLRISVESPPPPGPITIKMIGLPIFSGEVCWSGTHQIGVRLEHPMSSDCLQTWVKVHGSRR
jgi:hypothetical protein